MVFQDNVWSVDLQSLCMVSSLDGELLLILESESHLASNPRQRFNPNIHWPR